MLQITVNNINLDLLPEAVIPLYFNLCLLNKEIGSYSQSFKLPDTDVNNMALEQLKMRAKYRTPGSMDFECRVVIKNYTMYGTLTVINYTQADTGNVYNCYLKLGTGDFYSRIKDKTLQDFEYGGQISLGGSFNAAKAYIKASTTGSYPDYKFATFPVFNAQYYKDFYGGDPDYSTFKTTQNEWIITGLGDGEFNMQAWPDSNEFIFTPFLYNLLVIESIFAECGYHIEQNCFYDTQDLKATVIYNNTHPSYYQKKTLDYVSNFIEPKYHLPKITVTEYLQALESIYGVAININNATKKVSIVSLKNKLRAAVAKNLTDKCRGITITDVPTGDGYKLAWAADSSDDFYKNQIKDIYAPGATLKDPVLDYASLPTLGNTFGDVRLAKAEDVYYMWCFPEDGSSFGWVWYSLNIQPYIIGDGINVITSKGTPVCMYKVPQLEEGFNMSAICEISTFSRFINNLSLINGGAGYTVGLRYAMWGYGHSSIVEILEVDAGTGEIINVVISTTGGGYKTGDQLRVLEQVTDYGQCMIPRMDCPGNSIYHALYSHEADNPGTGWNDFALRFMIYKGMQYTDNASVQYPMGSMCAVGADAGAIPTWYTLTWGDVNESIGTGLYANFLREYYEWLQNYKEGIEMQMDLSTADLLGLEPFEKIRIENLNILIEKIETQAHKLGIDECRVLGYKI